VSSDPRESARLDVTQGQRRQPLASKVPEITALFWLVKIVTTGMGEALSDFLGTVNVPLFTAIGVVLLVGALWLQFRCRRYVAVAYWLVVSTVAVVGTMAADDVHAAGLPYSGSAAAFGVILAAVLYWWRLCEGTLSIHSIVTRRRESFYWLTVMVTFALGTALGDMTAETLKLGLLTSGLMFAGIILLPPLAWWRFHLNEVVAFWFAYIITRPLGASFADYLDKSKAGGGLNMGNGPVSAIAVVLVVALVAYLAVRRHDIQADIGSRPDAKPEIEHALPA
jgi:uncharacterized membrane-anchored protein